MSTGSERRPFLLRFFDTFLQEQNIRWMLCIGLMILLGSSLMLVSSNWENYSIGWRLLVLLGYTAGVHGLGQLTYHSLGLKKTGTGLMALTVLLLPLSFHGLRWVHPDGVLSAATLLDHVVLWGSLVAELAVCVLAATRIFGHFLRRQQPTFVAAYVLLCVAAALVPLLPTTFAPLTAVGCWAVFSVGSVKVNRHVFWLTEEYRLPRIFGFFPILLLGAQFLAIFSLSLAAHISLSWIGVGVVLTAMPVLLAADALARVFLEVQGKLTRPLPLSVAAPLTVGLMLLATGVCLAATEFPQAHAMVPAAALAAGMLGLVARRTGLRGFVWAMLICVTLSYQCSPTFFREIALQLVRSGASAVGESRLPVAFYGLTYLPLMAVLSVWAVRRKRHGDELFAPVMQRFVGCLSILLLIAATTHWKALFPVGAALTVSSLMQLGLFRARNRLLLAILAWGLTAIGLVPFLRGVLGFEVGELSALLTVTLASAVLVGPGRRLDRMTLAGLPDEQRKTAAPLCEIAGLIGVLLMSLVWLAVAAFSVLTGGLFAIGVLLGTLLLSLAVRWQIDLLSRFALLFAVGAPPLLVFAAGEGVVSTVTVSCSLLGALWVTVPLLLQWEKSAVSRAFLDEIQQLSHWGFVVATCVVVWPLAVATLLLGETFAAWPLALLTLGWAVSSAVGNSSSRLALMSWIGLLIVTGLAAFEVGVEDARSWLPTVWAAVSASVLLVRYFSRPKGEGLGVRAHNLGSHSERPAPLAHFLGGEGLGVRGERSLGSSSQSPLTSRREHSLHRGERSGDSRVLFESWASYSLWSLGFIAVTSLTFMSWPMRVAGLLATGSLIAAGMTQRRVVLTRWGWLLLNWQTLGTVLQFSLVEEISTFQLTGSVIAPAALSGAFVAAVQALGWRWAIPRGIGIRPFEYRSEEDRLEAYPTIDIDDLIVAQRRLLLAVVVIGLGVGLWAVSMPFDVLSVSFVIATFGVLVADCLTTAVRRAASPWGTAIPATAYVWLGEVVAAMGCGYLALAGVITFGSGLSMFVAVGLSLLALAIGRWSQGANQWQVLSQPLTQTGLLLPAVAVLMGLMRHASVPQSQWLGMNSLALLSAASIYFWRGIERRQKGLIVAAAGIVNVALALLWGELSWSDPQFFMIPLGLSMLGLVELLRAELPASSVNPLRYAASLVILVSPTFHIVTGSWLHLFSLMAASVVVTLLGMGLRIRASMYLGTAFLVADMLAMVIRGGVDRPSVLWVAGIALGMLVVALAAYCERHREQLLQRLRFVAAELETWQ